MPEVRHGVAAEGPSGSTDRRGRNAAGPLRNDAADAPVVVGFWCTLCLVAAAIMLVMIPLTVDEVVAMIQFMQRSVKEGKPFWRTFWVGGTVEGEENKDARSPDYGDSVARMPAAMVWGVTMPWNLVQSAAIGLWLMIAPAVLGSTCAAADSDHLIGALVLTIAVIAMAAVVRAGRYLNVLLGAWLGGGTLDSGRIHRPHKVEWHRRRTGADLAEPAAGNDPRAIWRLEPIHVLGFFD